MATPPLPLAAAQVLRRHVWRKVRIVALISALGVAGIGVDGAELKETAVLLQRGVSTQAMVTDKERLEDLWTLLTVEFPGGSDLPEVAVVLHEGDVTAKHVQIVYDPLDPATAQLEGDLQPGMLAVEVVLGGVMFILSDGDPLGRFPFAGAGLLLVLAALVMLLRVLRYRYRLLGIAVSHRAARSCACGCGPMAARTLMRCLSGLMTARPRGFVSNCWPTRTSAA